MSEPPTIYQCEACLRYCVPDGVHDCFVLLAVLPAHVGVPVACACGRSDCAGIARALAEQEAALARQAARAADQFRQRARVRREERVAGRKAKGNCRKASPREHGTRGTEPAQCHRGMPPEHEDDVRRVVVGSSQKEFLGAVNVGPAHRKLLDYFEEHYGEYVALPVLEGVCGHHAVNSRCSELRELIPHDHDIDQRNVMYEPTGRVHSHYRLCLKAESWRLLNKGQRDEQQQELTAEGGR